MQEELKHFKMIIFTWFAMSMFYFYSYYLRFTPSVMIDDLMLDFGITASMVSFISAIYYIGYASMQLPIGYICDSYGIGRPVFLCLFISCIGVFMFAFSSNVAMLFISRILIGFGVSIAYLGTLKFIANTLSPKSFALFGGITTMIGTIGAVSGQTMVSFLLDYFSWRMISLFSGFAGVLLLILLFVLFRRLNARVDSFEHIIADEGDGLIDLGFLKKTRYVIFNKNVLMTSVFAASLATTINAFGGLWSLPFFEHVYGFGKESVSLLSGALIVFWGIGCILWGFIGERVKTPATWIFFASLVNLIIFSTFIFFSRTSYLCVLFRMILMGLCSGTMILGFSTVRNYVSNNYSAIAMGFVNLIIILSSAFFQAAGGFVLSFAGGLESLGSKGYVYAVLPIWIYNVMGVVICGILAVLLAKKTNNSDLK